MTLMQKSRLHLQLRIILIVAYRSRPDELLACAQGEMKKLKFIVSVGCKRGRVYQEYKKKLKHQD